MKTDEELAATVRCINQQYMADHGLEYPPVIYIDRTSEDEDGIMLCAMNKDYLNIDEPYVHFSRLKDILSLAKEMSDLHMSPECPYHPYTDSWQEWHEERRKIGQRFLEASQRLCGDV